MKDILLHLENATGMLPGLERVAESQPMRNMLLISIDRIRMELVRARIAAENQGADA